MIHLRLLSFEFFSHNSPTRPVPETSRFFRQLRRAEANRCRPGLSARKNFYWSGVVAKLMRKLGKSSEEIAEYQSLFGR